VERVELRAQWLQYQQLSKRSSSISARLSNVQLYADIAKKLSLTKPVQKLFSDSGKEIQSVDDLQVDMTVIATAAGQKLEVPKDNKTKVTKNPAPRSKAATPVPSKTANPRYLALHLAQIKQRQDNKSS
jgi:hypothetical protein